MLDLWELTWLLWLLPLVVYLPFYFNNAQYTGRVPVTSFLTPFLASCFTATSLEEEKGVIDPHGQYIFALFPHHAMSFSHLLTASNANSFNEIFPGEKRKHAMASPLFRIPLIREILLQWGGVDASRPTLKRMLNQGDSVFVLPGGEHEQLASKYNQEILYLQKRKGFCRLAVEHKVKLVPIYAFGESRLYHCSSFLLSFRLWLVKKFRMGIPLVSGRWLLFPFSAPLTMCIGRPIDVPELLKSLEDEAGGEDRTNVWTDRVHEIFVHEIERLFEENKKKYGYEDNKLQFI